MTEQSYISRLSLNGRVALVSKLHHCMADGASGASQMSTLLDLAPQRVSR